MNDEALSGGLRTLFEPEGLSVDVHGPGADALFELVVSQPQSILVPEITTVTAPEFDVDDLDLHRPEPVASPRWLLVAAIVIVIAAIGASSWTIDTNDSGAVLSDDVEENGEADVAESNFQADRMEIIPGSSDALVTIATADLDGRFVEVLRCSRQFRNPIGRVTLESPSLTYANGFPASGLALDVIHLDEGTKHITCGAARGSYNAGAAEILSSTDISGALILGSSGSSSGRFDVDGRLAPDVLEVRVIDPVPEWQVFRQSNGWFRIDGEVGSARDVGDEALFEIEFADGATTMLTTEELTGDDDLFACRNDSVCVRERVSELSQRATEAGATEQAIALSDNLLTQAEYDNALDSFEQCLLALSSVQVDPPAMFVEDSAGAKAALACHRAEIAFIEDAVVWQNSHLLATQSPGDAEVVDASLVSMVVFFGASVTQGEVDQVAGLLSAENIDWVYMSQAETYDEFVEFFASDPVLLDTISIETMPPSLRLQQPASDELVETIEALPQVRSVVLSTRELEGLPN